MVRTVLPIEDHPHVGTPIKMVLFYLLLRPFSLFCFFVFLFFAALRRAALSFIHL